MPAGIFGIRTYLTIALVCLALVVVIGLTRRGGGSAPRASHGGIGQTIQLISAILGIVSFVIQIAQWLKVI